MISRFEGEFFPFNICTLPQVFKMCCIYSCCMYMYRSFKIIACYSYYVPFFLNIFIIISRSMAILFNFDKDFAPGQLFSNCLPFYQFSPRLFNFFIVYKKMTRHTTKLALSEQYRVILTLSNSQKHHKNIFVLLCGDKQRYSDVNCRVGSNKEGI